MLLCITFIHVIEALSSFRGGSAFQMLYLPDSKKKTNNIYIFYLCTGISPTLTVNYTVKKVYNLEEKVYKSCRAVEH